MFSFEEQNCDDVLRNESVDAAHDVHDLSDAEAHRNATESGSI